MSPFTKTVLIIINILFAASIILWPFALYLSLFMFDAPGSASNPVIQSIWMLLWIYPVGVIVGNTLFWIKLKKSSSKSLIGLTLINVICPILIFVLMLFY